MIYIYDDGIHANAYLLPAFQEIMPKADIRFCTASMILNSCLDNASLLIIPGGADLYFCEKLNGKGNTLIKNFVTNGGSYLGICAGAYYGCSSLDWDKGAIEGVRELALYEGKATGPVYDWIEDARSIYQGSWKNAVRIDMNDNESLHTLYNGGPVFDEPYKSESYVIARYAELPDTPPAIVGGTFGDGRYILASPHIERFGHYLNDRLYKLNNNSYDREKSVFEELKAHEKAQKEFLKSILNRLL